MCYFFLGIFSTVRLLIPFSFELSRCLDSCHMDILTSESYSWGRRWGPYWAKGRKGKEAGGIHSRDEKEHIEKGRFLHMHDGCVAKDMPQFML